MYFKYIRFMKPPSGHNVLSSSPGARTATGGTEAKRLVSLLLSALGVSEKIRRFIKSIDPEAEDSIRI
ncbi:hypothetical protein PYWP30_00935 [Pyrobaculum sp. WP30]|nr:hypothetical protein PYWP30_00935 [Pyrobaculum sp. WP30]